MAARNLRVVCRSRDISLARLFSSLILEHKSERNKVP